MNRVNVQPALLRWARERSGRSVTDLRKRFPMFAAWEQGEVRPTLKQLEAFARTTYTPIGYMFLPEPPVEKLPITDFRTMSDVPVSRPSADLLDTLYLCQQRQEWYRDEARSAGEAPLQFVGSMDETADPVSAAASIRQMLRFDLDQRRQSLTWTDALRRFIDEADTLGILVMVSGIVGSNTHRPLDPEEFRGFVLSDPLAPLIFINGADTKAAQMFTLAHEIAHLWLGTSGISNIEAKSMPDHVTERWCNHVAAELLVPSDVIRQELHSRTGSGVDVNRLARRFKVSTLVVLRRVHDVGRLDEDSFWSAYRTELDRLHGLRGGSGGHAIRNVGARVSKRLARALVVSTLEGRTSYTDSFRMLGVRKLSTFKQVAESLGMGV